MDYLSRDTSPLAPELWAQLDAAVVKVARSVLTGRRVLHLNGPLGAGVTTAAIDDADARAERIENGFITSGGRRLVEIPTLYEDFALLARDIAASEKAGTPLDLSAVYAAAQAAALREDRLIFQGNEALGYEGLLSAAGVNRLSRSDWAVGENAFSDVVIHSAIRQRFGRNVFFEGSR